MTIRAYTDSGEKVFLPFNLRKFKSVIAAAKTRDLANPIVEQALSSATGNIDESGRRHTHLRVEWLERDPKTGKTNLQ
jgi:hypothetical protein